MKEKTNICLTIAGVDPSGGAGVIADIKTFMAFECYPTAVIASLTFQNTCGVYGVINQTAEAISGQFLPIIEDFEVSAIKTGMLPNKEVIEKVAEIIKTYDLPRPVVDPVVRSTSGFDLIDNEALRSLIEKLFPLARLVTPNIPEAERISGNKIETEKDLFMVAEKIQGFGAENVLIKGGHLNFSNEQTEKKARDYLFCGKDVEIFETEFLETTATHGTGCTLAAAITANLAHGNDLKKAVEKAKNFVFEAIKTSPLIGKGHSPVNHQVKVLL